MATDRCAKWSQDAQEFFAAALDNSLTLDIVVSLSCKSQTGEGFEELVNSINSENIKRKVKKVNITDASYLYRHVIPSFSKYADPHIPTEWFLNNEDSIKKLTVETELKSWALQIQTDVYKRWYEQILFEFAGDEKGNGIVQEFRDLTIADAAVAAYKDSRELKDCIDFMLEESAHACANLRSGINLVYPMYPSRPVWNLAKRYNIKINHLRYRASVQTQNSPDHVSIDYFGDIDNMVASFLKENATTVNFFVMDKYGNHIYRNYAYDTFGKEVDLKEINFGRLDPQSWKNSMEVMKTRKQMIIEEATPFGNTYLTVKAPLIINKKIEGVIGLAVDITDRKRAERLEAQNAQQQLEIDSQNKIRTIFERFVRKMNSHLTELATMCDENEKLSEEEKAETVGKVICINIIIKDLLNALEKNSLEDFKGLIK